MQRCSDPPRNLEDPKAILDHVEGLEKANPADAGATRGSVEGTAPDARAGGSVQGARGQSEPTQAGEQALIDGDASFTESSKHIQ